MEASLPSSYPEQTFPVGTPVCVHTTTWRRDRATRTETIGTIEAWEVLPTGSWFVHGRHDRLWLRRLKLRKLDGEISLLIVDDSTAIAKLEAAKAGS